jgi:hypothetical protein
MNLSLAVQDVTHSGLSTYLSKVAGLIIIPRLPRRYSSHETCATSANGMVRPCSCPPAISRPPVTGAGWMNESKACRARSRTWPVAMPGVSG